MAEVAVIFGMQRCGSNYFLSACRRLDDMLVLGEMYHRGGVFPFQPNPQMDFAVKQRLAGILQDRFEEQSTDCLIRWDRQAEFGPAATVSVDEALVKFSHRHPAKYLAALQDMAGGRRLIFKIFPEHLDLTSILAVLRQQRPRVILMMRNPLDSFISYKKLVETKKPQDVDTSSLRISFNKAEYYAYKAGLVSFFGAIREFCQDEWISHSVSHYEMLHAGEEAAKPDKVRDYLQHVFGAPLTFSDTLAGLKLFRQQDRTASASEKVLNPGQLPQQPQVLL